MQMGEISTASLNTLNARLSFHEDKAQERVFHMHISTDYPWCNKAPAYLAVTPRQSHRPGLDLLSATCTCATGTYKKEHCKIIQGCFTVSCQGPVVITHGDFIAAPSQTVSILLARPRVLAFGLLCSPLEFSHLRTGTLWDFNPVNEGTNPELKASLGVRDFCSILWFSFQMLKYSWELLMLKK